jgi:putative phage-type endonuclease
MDEELQRTDEWYARRLGKVTASRIADMMAKTKSGWGASRGNYMAELLVERLTGQRTEGYQSAAMLAGIETEAQAKRAYCFRYGVEIVDVEFVDHPEITMAGASPDGLVGDDGLIEIKSPFTATHIHWLRGGPIDDKYLKQVQFQMACTGRVWCDFVSFDQRMPEHMALFVQRVRRDQGFIGNLEHEVRVFLRELEEMQAELMRMYPE